jgi:hypothetical protein
MSQTETAVLKVRIHSYSAQRGMYKNVKLVKMQLLEPLNELVDFREIVFDRRKMHIKRPGIDNNTTIKLSHTGHCDLLLKDHDLVGEYEVEVLNTDCLKLTKLCNQTR